MSKTNKKDTVLSRPEIEYMSDLLEIARLERTTGFRMRQDTGKILMGKLSQN